MTLRRPAAHLRFDGRELALDESATATLAVVSTATGGHDRATLTLGPGSPVIDVAPSTTVEIEIGYGDDTAAVLTGAVARVHHRPWGTSVEVVSATGALDGVRVGRSYVARTVGDIVTDLAGEGGVRTGDVDAGVTMPVFHVDETRSAWRHLRNLVRLTGTELTSAPDGAINVRPPRRGAADHTLRGGAELIAWAVGSRSELAAVASVGPYSAASEQGTEAWSLVHHDPGGSGPHLVHPALRDREIADAVDHATAERRRRAGRQGRAVVVGDPAVRAGDLVELTDVARAAATYRLLAARHEIDLDGFRTTLWMEAA